jgi:hypothetical protein
VSPEAAKYGVPKVSAEFPEFTAVTVSVLLTDPGAFLPALRLAAVRATLYALAFALSVK